MKQNIKRALELAQQIITLLEDADSPPSCHNSMLDSNFHLKQPDDIEATFKKKFLEAEARYQREQEDKAEARTQTTHPTADIREPLPNPKCENCEHLGGRWKGSHLEWKCFRDIDNSVLTNCIHPVYLSGRCPSHQLTDNNDALAELQDIKQFIDNRINSTRMIAGDYNEPARRIRCKDGYSVSIQAGNGKYSTPAFFNINGYTEYELGFPSEHDGTLVEYMERNQSDRQVSSVFPYTPASVVTRLILRHGGLDHQLMREKDAQDIND